MNNVSLVEQAILFGTESFIKTQKEYTKCKNKKKQLVIFVIFISNKKMESLKQRCLKILVGDSEKPYGKYFHNTELETIDKTSKIPKIYRTLMIFIHLMKY